MFGKTLKIALMMAVGVFNTLVTITALAQNTSQVAGELSKTGTVTINGTPAISGATIFTDSQLKTERNSGATISLGKLGKVQLGPETEMTLRFAEGSIGGNLTSGRAVVHSAAGVAVSIVTADGVATADGKQAADLTVDVTCGNTRVGAANSQAKVTSGSKVEFVAAGSEVSVGQQAPATPRCGRLAATKPSRLGTGAIAALVIVGVGGALAGVVSAAEGDDVTPSSVVVSSPRP
jgi:hypothetical protein